MSNENLVRSIEVIDEDGTLSTRDIVTYAGLLSKAHEQGLKRIETNLLGACTCCKGIRGNINGDTLEAIDISDLTALVNYMFKNGPEPPCMDEADVNGDQSQNIADLTHLVGYMFKSGPAPNDCP